MLAVLSLDGRQGLRAELYWQRIDETQNLIRDAVNLKEYPWAARPRSPMNVFDEVGG